ncbi:MAG: YbgC/FadM family acyl-CoA thioesterase [Gammaproteobacteria bacterium]|nr:YbgC/FadM family acyl-CoA thioesterase [Gammaproteobacteria bacterium]
MMESKTVTGAAELGQMKTFTFNLQVYSEDTDTFGIVHHANYIKFMERARLAWLWNLGLRIDHLFSEGIFFVIKKIEIKYLSAARLYDELEIISTVISMRRVSKVYLQIIRSKVDPSTEYCRATIEVVCVNNKLRPQAMPPELLENRQ